MTIRNVSLKKILCSVVTIMFLMNNVAFGLAPGVVSGELRPDGDQLKGDMYAGAMQLFGAKRGPGAINFDAIPRSFAGEAAKIGGVRIVKTDWDHMPKGWEKNPILKMTNILGAFNHYKKYEAQIPHGMLWVKVGHFDVDEAAGELPIARIERDGDINTLVIHYKFAQIWEEIRRNDIWFEVDFTDESGEKVTRTVSVAWALFYRVVKHEMTDLTKKEGAIKGYLTDFLKPAVIGHATRTVNTVDESFGAIFSYDEKAANAIGGRYSLVNDGIWLWFLGSYCFTNSTRYSNPVLRERLEWFFKEKPGLVKMAADRLAGRADGYGDFSDEFPNLSHPYTRDFAMNIALLVNHSYFSRASNEGRLIPALEAGKIEVPDDLIKQAELRMRDSSINVLYATGTDAGAAAQANAELPQADLIQRFMHEDSSLSASLQEIHKELVTTLSLPSELANHFFMAALLYYERAYFLGEVQEKDLAKRLSELSALPQYQLPAQIFLQLSNRRMGDTDIMAKIWAELNGAHGDLASLMTYFDEVRLRWNLSLADTGRYHDRELFEAYRKAPHRLSAVIDDLLSRMRQAGFTFKYEDWMNGFARRRLSGETPAVTGADSRFGRRIVIIHNDLGASVPHPHQQAFFLPSDFVPESKTGVERFVDAFPGNILWYEDREGCQFGELFGWPVTTGIIQGADEREVAAKVYELTGMLLAKGLRFDVLLGSYVDPVTREIRPRFFIFARKNGEESLKPNKSKFGNMWATFEMSGGLIIPDEQKFEAITSEDACQAYNETTADPLYQVLGLPQPQNIPARLSSEKIGSFIDLYFVPGRADVARLQGTKGSRPGGDFLAYYHWPVSEKAVRLNPQFSIVPNPIPFAPHGLVIYEDRTGAQDLPLAAVQNMLAVWKNVLGQESVEKTNETPPVRPAEVKPVTAAPDPFEVAREQVGDIAKIIDLDPVLLNGLDDGFKGFLNTQLLTAVYLNVPMDDGMIKVFHAYRSLDNDARGAGKGGIRWDIGVTENEVRALSKWMSLKCAVVGIPYGGGKGGILCDPKKLSAGEKERLMRKYTAALVPNVRRAVIGPLKDVPAPDMGTNAEIMDWMRDEYTRRTGDPMAPAIVTGKPVGKGGSLGRDKATGQGVFYTTIAALKLAGDSLGIGTDIKGKRVIIEAYGNVGSWTARIFHKAGAKIVAIREWNGTIYNPDGIDIDALDAHLKNGGTFTNFNGATLITENTFWSTGCDILVPAFRENQITAEVAKKIRSKMIVEAANGPTTPEADKILKENGIMVVPDILANAGGVVVSYFEWLQNLEEESWTLTAVDKMLEERMRLATISVFDTAKRYGISLRKAAGVIAVIRMVHAELARNGELAKLFSAGHLPYKGFGEALFVPETLEELNAMVKTGQLLTLIQSAEKQKSAEIDRIADQAARKLPRHGNSLIFIAGPVTGGKIGLSVNLMERFKAKGRRVVRIDGDRMPGDAIVRLRNGKEVTVTDFVKGKEVTRRIKLGKNDIVVIEGNYMLSSEVLSIVPEENRFGIFVNTAPSMKLADNWPLTSLDLRLLRHILTMHQTEKASPLAVIKGWANERKRQIEGVYPTWPNADVTFNGYLPYELTLISSRMAELGLLSQAKQEAQAASDAEALKVIARLERTLKDVERVNIVGLNIPDDSIVQQYIGGVELYEKMTEPVSGAAEAEPAVATEQPRKAGDQWSGVLDLEQMRDAAAKLSPEQLVRGVIEGAYPAGQVKSALSSNKEKLAKFETALTEWIKALTPGQIRTLTEAQIWLLTPEQVQALTPEQIRALTPAQTWVMTEAQIWVMTEDQTEVLKQVSGDQWSGVLDFAQMQKVVASLSTEELVQGVTDGAYPIEQVRAALADNQDKLKAFDDAMAAYIKEQLRQYFKGFWTDSTWLDRSMDVRHLNALTDLWRTVEEIERLFADQGGLSYGRKAYLASMIQRKGQQHGPIISHDERTTSFAVYWDQIKKEILSSARRVADIDRLIAIFRDLNDREIVLAADGSEKIDNDIMSMEISINGRLKDDARVSYFYASIRSPFFDEQGSSNRPTIGDYFIDLLDGRDGLKLIATNINDASQPEDGPDRVLAFTGWSISGEERYKSRTDSLPVLTETGMPIRYRISFSHSALRVDSLIRRLEPIAAGKAAFLQGPTQARREDIIKEAGMRLESMIAIIDEAASKRNGWFEYMSAGQVVRAIEFLSSVETIAARSMAVQAIAATTDQPRNADGIYAKRPGKSPADMLKLIALYGPLSEPVTAPLLTDLYHTWWHRLGFQEPSANHLRTAERDLFEASGSLLDQGIVRETGRPGKARRFVLTDTGRERIAEALGSTVRDKSLHVRQRLDACSRLKETGQLDLLRGLASEIETIVYGSEDLLAPSASIMLQREAISYLWFAGARRALGELESIVKDIAASEVPSQADRLEAINILKALKARPALLELSQLRDAALADAAKAALESMQFPAAAPAFQDGADLSRTKLSRSPEDQSNQWSGVLDMAQMWHVADKLEVSELVAGVERSAYPAEQVRVALADNQSKLKEFEKALAAAGKSRTKPGKSPADAFVIIANHLMDYAEKGTLSAPIYLDEGYKPNYRKHRFDAPAKDRASALKTARRDLDGLVKQKMLKRLAKRGEGGAILFELTKRGKKEAAKIKRVPKVAAKKPAASSSATADSAAVDSATGSGRATLIETGYQEGYLFDPAYTISKRDAVVHQPVVKMPRTLAEIRALLQKAKDSGVPIEITAHLRGVDGPGSSLDLPEFQVKLTKQDAKAMSEITSTPTLASDFSVTIRFEAADDPNVIEYVAPDYGITADNPYVVRGNVQLKDGKTPRGQADAPAYIFTNLFGVTGVRITCERISPMALAGGMESSNAFNVALFAAASALSGANWTMADIFSKAVEIENNELGGLTGGQGHLASMLGGAYQHMWLSGIKGANGELINPYGAFSMPFLAESDFAFIEEHMALAQAGKEYKDGKAAAGRTAALINNMWTDLLREGDPAGVKLHTEKLGLAARYIAALKDKDMATVVAATNRYVDIRDALCRRWAECVLNESKAVWLERMEAGDRAAIASYGLTDEVDLELINLLVKSIRARIEDLAKLGVDKDADDRRQLLQKDLTNLNNRLNHWALDNLKAISDKKISLYSDSAKGLIAAARSRGMAVMPLGAGGPGANLVVISQNGMSGLQDLFAKENLPKLTDEGAEKIVRGSGVLRGFMPFTVGREPIQFNGFEERGLVPPALPVKAVYSEKSVRFSTDATFAISTDMKNAGAALLKRGLFGSLTAMLRVEYGKEGDQTKFIALVHAICEDRTNGDNFLDSQSFKDLPESIQDEISRIVGEYALGHTLTEDSHMTPSIRSAVDDLASAGEMKADERPASAIEDAEILKVITLVEGKTAKELIAYLIATGQLDKQAESFLIVLRSDPKYTTKFAEFERELAEVRADEADGKPSTGSTKPAADASDKPAGTTQPGKSPGDAGDQWSGMLDAQQMVEFVGSVDVDTLVRGVVQGAYPEDQVRTALEQLPDNEATLYEFDSALADARFSELSGEEAPASGVWSGGLDFEQMRTLAQKATVDELIEGIASGAYTVEQVRDALAGDASKLAEFEAVWTADQNAQQETAANDELYGGANGTTPAAGPSAGGRPQEQVTTATATDLQDEVKSVPEVIFEYIVRVAKNEGPGSIPELTLEEQRAVWETVALLHESRIEIFVPKNMKLTESMKKALGDIRKREGEDVIKCREYMGSGHLYQLLSKAPAPGTKRVVVTEVGALDAMKRLVNGKPEVFADTRLYNTTLPKGYDAMDAVEKTVCQARVIQLAILMRLFEKDKTPMVEMLLRIVLADRLDDGVTADEFINKIAEDGSMTTVKRILWFLDAPVSLIEKLGKELKLLKEVWTAA